jgi:peroxiredoxin Q/BCP
MIRVFDVTYFAASVDDAETNRRFAVSLEADYPILSDPERKAAAAYGVLRSEGGTANRWTFYIGKDGKILLIDRKVNARTAGQDLAAKLDELGVAKAK